MTISRILSVDLGNYNTKTSAKKVFESRFEKVKIDKESFGSKEVLIYNNEKYLMEKGFWDLGYNKAEKDYMPCLLTAIAKSFPTLKNITGLGVVLGLPLTQLKNKDKIISDLEGKTFEFNYNGVNKIVEFAKVGVIGEGFSSIYTLSESDRTDDILLVDIGGRTINVVDYSDNEVENTDTFSLGMYDFYHEIHDELLADSNVGLEKVRRLIETNKLDTDVVEEKKKAFIEKLTNYLKPFNPQYKKIFFTGGGSLTLKEELKDFNDGSEFLNDVLFSNVLGNKMLAEMSWGE